MRLSQWLIFISRLPHFSALAKQAEVLDFKRRFDALQMACLSLLKSLGIKLSIDYEEPLQPNQALYMVCNHQGTFDPILLVASAPVAHSFISKVENLKLPIIGQWGRLIHFITFNRDDFNENVTMLRQATRFLKDGKSLLVFPEGTRSKSNHLQTFKAGSLLPAYLAKAPIVPIALYNAYSLNHSKTVHIHYGKVITYDAYQHLSYEDLSKELHQTIQALMDTHLCA